MLKTFFMLSLIIFSSTVCAQGVVSNDNIEKVVLEVLDESQGSDNLNDINNSDDNSTLVIPR